MEQTAADPGAIVIGDLAQPQLTPKIIAARIGPGDFPDTLSVDEILARASEAAGGLADFGPDDFKARLAVYVRSWEQDEGLTRGGRITLLQQAVRVMANRLRIEDLVKRRPEILEIEIDRPIIIAGLPRSGTTHLVNGFARDLRLRSLTLWESEEPVPSTMLAPGEADPRLARAAEFWGEFEAMLPHVSAMHGMEASSIHEDNELLHMDVNSYNWEWQARSPSWTDYYFSHDRSGSYLYEKKVLQVLTWFRGPNRWILKSPQHMENLAAMKAAFPDATMVITHRDPVAVLQSLLTMVAYCDRIRRDPVDPHGLALLWTDRIERLLRACLEQRSAWGPTQSRDVMFHQFMANQEQTMRQVYRQADLELTPDAEAILQGYLAENPRNKHGRVVYDLEADFDVKVEDLQRRFQFYYDAFPVQREL